MGLFSPEGLTSRGVEFSDADSFSEEDWEEEPSTKTISPEFFRLLKSFSRKERGFLFGVLGDVGVEI